MEKKFVINSKNLPSRPLTQPTIIAFMAIEIWSLGEIWQGVIYTMLALLWIGYFAAEFHTEVEVDVFSGKKLGDAQIKEKP